MKNLKRTLCLVLCLVMAIGLLATGASAAFKDDSTVTYKEAVELLSGLGVINGYEDGTFRPTENFNRAGLAKMVAYFSWGGADRSSLYSGANVFADVDSYAWAKGSINYGYNAGYISGAGTNAAGKTVYNPAGTVKGSELAKTLLCVLGYKANATDPAYALVGSAWELNSIRLAEKEGLFAGLKAGFDATAALTREEAAQIFYNALGKGIYTQYNDDKTPVTTVVSGTPMTVFFGCTPSEGTDAVGRPAVVYTRNGKVVSTIVKDAAFTFTAETTEQAMAVAMKGYTVNVLTTDNYEDGAGSQGALSTTNAIAALTANGVKVECYNTGSVITDVVVTNYYIGKVAVTAATALVDRYITVGGMNFTTNDFAKDDIVIYTKDESAIATVALAKKVENVSVTTYSGDLTGSFTAAGVTYAYSDGFDTTFSDVDANAYNFSATYDLYVDDFGYVIGNKTHTAGVSALDYAVVTDAKVVFAAGTGAFATAASVKVQVTYMDGTTAVLDVPVKVADKANTSITYQLLTGSVRMAAGDSYIAVGSNYYRVSGDPTTENTVTAVANALKGIHSFKLDGSNIVLSNTLSTSGTPATTGDKASGSLSFKKNTASVGISGAFANASTKLVSVNKGVVTTYAGYANFPASVWEVNASNKDVFYVKTGNVITNILVLGDSVSAPAATPDAYAYFTNVTRVVPAADGSTATQYQLLKSDGTKEFYTCNSIPSANTVYSFAMEADGTVTLATEGFSVVGTLPSTGATIATIDTDYFTYGTNGANASAPFAAGYKVVNIKGAATGWAADTIEVGDEVVYVTATNATTSVVETVLVLICD